MHPHGKVNKCFVIAILCEKIVLEAFHYVVPKAFGC